MEFKTKSYNLTITVSYHHRGRVINGRWQPTLNCCDFKVNCYKNGKPVSGFYNYIDEVILEADKRTAKTLSTLKELYKYNGAYMCPDCEHLINIKQSDKQLKIHRYILNSEGLRLSKIRDISPFSLDVEEGMTNFPIALYNHDYTYDYRKQRVPRVERKIANWVRFTEQTPNGILGKPCPICGYKYGSSWRQINIPEKDFKKIIYYSHKN